MRLLPDQLVFDRAELRALGWSEAAISRAVTRGAIRVVRRGQFTAAPQVTSLIRCAAAVRDVAGSVVSHRSALLSYGLPLIGSAPSRPEITVASNGPGSVEAAQLHRATTIPEHIRHVRGIPTTTVARTLVDVGRSQPTITAVAAMDAAMQRKLVTREEICDVVRLCTGLPRIRRAVRALSLADGRAESALETLGRMVFPKVGIPAPELQVVIRDTQGHERARLDYYWDELGVAGEADGNLKYDGITVTDKPGNEVLDDEKQRQEIAESLQLQFWRFGWRHAWSSHRELRRRYDAAVERAAALARAGVPRLWTAQLMPFR